MKIAPTKTKARVDVLFRAFSDRTRLRILCLLRKGELCVCDLVDLLSVRQPTVSRHLAYLRKTGLVVVRKDGLWSHYRLAPSTSACHAKLLECLHGCFDDVPGVKADARRLATCGPGCCD
jgi:ArsR family transcriptional regulator, arsenate/arsenite/antimonite-responsive transcriptional repressor